MGNQNYLSSMFGNGGMHIYTHTDNATYMFDEIISLPSNRKIVYGVKWLASS